MTALAELTFELSSLVASANGYASYSSSAQAFDSFSKGYVGYLTGEATDSGTLQATFQHSLDEETWETLITCSMVSGMASVYGFESQSNNLRPLLPKARVCLGLTAGDADMEYRAIAARLLTEK